MIHRFGDFDLDEERFELRRAGLPVELEPRAFELLSFLARNPRRIVSKDELVREVWQGKFVSDAAVTYAVGVVRRAIAGDPAVSLATVHGRGYRLEAEVAQFESRPAEPAAQPPSPVAARPQALVEAAPERTPPPRWRTPRAALAAGILATAFLLALWIVRPPRSEARPEQARSSDEREPRAVALVLAAPEAPEGETELHLLGVSLLDAVRARLEGVPGLTLLLDDPAAGDLSAAPRLLLTLEADRRSDRARLRALLVEGTDGPRSPIGRFDVPLLSKAADLEAFNAARETIATFVVDFLLPAVELSGPEPGLVPRDAEAYRLYLLANDISEDVICDDESFVDLVRASLARDERFAPAWEVLGWAHYGQVVYCGGDGSHYVEALEAADKALAIAPRWAPAMLLKVSILAETGRWAEAWEAVERSAPPTDPTASWEFARSYLLNYVGEIDRSVAHLEAAVADNPIFLSFGSWTPNALLYSGQNERFLELVPAANSPLMSYYHAEALVRGGRSEEAIAVLRPVFAARSTDLFARLAESFRLHLEGDAPAAREALLAVERQRREGAATDGEVTFKIASLAARLGAPDDALAALELAIDQGFACAPCAAGDPAFDRLRADPRFEAVLAKARERARSNLEAADAALPSRG